MHILNPRYPLGRGTENFFLVKDRINYNTKLYDEKWKGVSCNFINALCYCND